MFRKKYAFTYIVCLITSLEYCKCADVDPWSPRLQPQYISRKVQNDKPVRINDKITKMFSLNIRTEGHEFQPLGPKEQYKVRELHMRSKLFAPRDQIINGKTFE